MRFVRPMCINICIWLYLFDLPVRMWVNTSVLAVAFYRGWGIRFWEHSPSLVFLHGRPCLDHKCVGGNKTMLPSSSFVVPCRWDQKHSSISIATSLLFDTHFASVLPLNYNPFPCLICSSVLLSLLFSGFPDPVCHLVGSPLDLENRSPCLFL